MQNRPVRPGTITRPEVGAMGCAVATVVLMSPVGVLQPFWTRVYPAANLILPMVGFFTGIAALILLATAATSRRPFLVPAAVVIGCGAMSYLYLSGSGVAKSWEREFYAKRPQLIAAARWVNKQRLPVEEDRGRLTLPTEYASLANRGEVHWYRNEAGQVWYCFPQFIIGLDDGMGYAWSKSGKAPPKRAYPSIIRTQPLKDGWHLFWFT